MKRAIYTVIETITILIAIFSLYLVMTTEYDALAIGSMMIAVAVNSLMLGVDGEEECQG